MHPRLSRFACLLILATAAALPTSAQPGRSLSLGEALAEAERRSPELRASAAAVEAARARWTTARTFPHNPEVEVEAAARSGAGGSTTDRGLGVSQRFEVAGQRRHRVAAAEAALAAAEVRHRRRRFEVRSAVELAFAETVRDRRLRETAAADLELTRRLSDFEARRLDAGAGTQIELNLTRAASGRATHRLQQATAAWWRSRAALAEACGLDPSAPPEAAGRLPATAEPLPPLAELARRALATRRDLAALRHDREGAERGTRLERALARPDLTVGAFAGHEEGDDVAGLRFGVSIPLFDRNRGRIAEAAATETRAAADLELAELAAGRQVAAAHARHQAAAEALAALSDLVVDTQEESLELLRRAVEEGEMSTTDVLILRRELVEGEREQIEAAGELWRARIELELAVGGAILRQEDDHAE